jgi:pimeloyl-ACP methyl ester carboxylesterase
MNLPWLDRAAYPFAHHTLAVDGGLMHYVDEGAGEPILFVHGTTTWSFLYRDLIRDLSRDYRCIAPDHIGFGLSDKPAGWGYQFPEHTGNLAALVDHLGLERFTLVAHDVGGPISLSYALNQPGRVTRLLLMNSFLWPLRGPFAVAPALAGRLVDTALGRLLLIQLNAEVRWLVPLVYGDRAKLTPAIHRQYLAPFPRPADRHGVFAMARQVLSGAGWCQELWEQRTALAGIPAAIVWGMKDPLFGPRFLARWREALPGAEVVELARTGHFVAEEQPAAVLQALRRLLARSAA